MSRKQVAGDRPLQDYIEHRSGSETLQVEAKHWLGDSLSQVVWYGEPGASIFEGPPYVIAEVRDAPFCSVGIVDVGVKNFTLVLTLIAPVTASEEFIHVDWDAMLDHE
jgi:hypothetical protein